MCLHHIKTVQVTIVLEGVMVDVKQKGQKVVKFWQCILARTVTKWISGTLDNFKRC